MPGTDHYTNLEEEHVSHDIVIRNGVIADGTGEELFDGDIAIDGETITQLLSPLAGSNTRRSGPYTTNVRT